MDVRHLSDSYQKYISYEFVECQLSTTYRMPLLSASCRSIAEIATRKAALHRITYPQRYAFLEINTFIA